MTEMTRTLCFVLVALVLTATAALAALLPGFGGHSAEFGEQGEPFFAEFNEAVEADPLAAKVLEVVEYDADTASVKPFQVQFLDGAWTIPSHHDYPAKAEEKMARVAAAVAQMKKDALRSDRADDHEALGVVDPLDAKATSLKGRGTHVILRDRPGGKALADFIVGPEVPDKPGMRYVRQAGKNRTYGVNVALDLSTDFSTWIDTDLVNIPASEVTRLQYDTRKVDPDRLEVVPGDPITLEKTTTAGQGTTGASWALEGLEPGEQTDTAKVDDVVRAVDGLRVIGVRPLPQGSGNDALLRSLASKGFYPTRQGELLSNQGSVRLGTDKGLEYTLRFGEVTFASGEALTAGTGEEKKMAGADLVAESADPDAPKPDEKKGETESRFVIVTVGFDPTLLPAPEEKPVGELPDDLFARGPDDPVRVEAEKKAKDEADRLAERRESLTTEGEEKVAELNRTLSKYYFVVPGADFKRVLLTRDDFLKKPGSDSPAASGSSPLPAGLGDSLPPGLSLPQLSPH